MKAKVSIVRTDPFMYRFSSKEWNDGAGLYYYLYRYYDPNLQRWPNRDPISEIGFFKSVRPRFEILRPTAKDYLFVLNSPVDLADAEGLWQVCCRPVRGSFGVSLFTHCDVREGPCDPDPGGRGYPVVPDPSCGGGGCQSDKQMSDCLKQHPTTAGNSLPGDNCQSSTLDALKACCAKAPGWQPSWYAYPPSEPGWIPD